MLPYDVFAPKHNRAGDYNARMRLAALDFGTNTALLLIADFDGKNLQVVEDHADIVRVGEGLDRSGKLKPEAIARGLLALDRYVARIVEAQCSHVVAVGTEALRRAENGALFVNEATARLGRVGGTFQVIDGEREAALAWRATRGSFPALRGPRTVVDIGGGSTEILVGDERIDEVVSLPIGSVRLTERLLHADPVDPGERAALIETIDRALDQAPRAKGPIIGIAGTVTTLSAMAQSLDTYDGNRVHGHRLSRETIAALCDRLAQMPLFDRRRTPGLDPRRADVIFAGATLLERILVRAQASECIVSDRGIRWGVIYEAVGIG